MPFYVGQSALGGRDRESSHRQPAYAEVKGTVLPAEQQGCRASAELAKRETSKCESRLQAPAFPAWAQRGCCKGKDTR
jgi:hypothetical protein